VTPSCELISGLIISNKCQPDAIPPKNAGGSEFAPEWRQQTKPELECGSMPNVMAAMPNIGGALCSTPQSLADAHYKSAVH